MYVITVQSMKMKKAIQDNNYLHTEHNINECHRHV